MYKSDGWWTTILTTNLTRMYQHDVDEQQMMEG